MAADEARATRQQDARGLVVVLLNGLAVAHGSREPALSLAILAVHRGHSNCARQHGGQQECLNSAAKNRRQLQSGCASEAPRGVRWPLSATWSEVSAAARSTAVVTGGLAADADRREPKPSAEESDRSIHSSAWRTPSLHRAFIRFRRVGRRRRVFASSALVLFVSESTPRKHCTGAHRSAICIALRRRCESSAPAHGSRRTVRCSTEAAQRRCLGTL